MAVKLENHTNGYSNGVTDSTHAADNHTDHKPNGSNSHPPSTNGHHLHEVNGISNGGLSHETQSDSAYEPIAIIGCAMRLPGGISEGEALWNLLTSKGDGRCRVPADRYNVEAFYGTGKANEVCTEYG